jgi:hypothetical protein
MFLLPFLALFCLAAIQKLSQPSSQIEILTFGTSAEEFAFQTALIPKAKLGY